MRFTRHPIEYLNILQPQYKGTFVTKIECIIVHFNNVLYLNHLTFIDLIAGHRYAQFCLKVLDYIDKLTSLIIYVASSIYTNFLLRHQKIAQSKFENST